MPIQTMVETMTAIANTLWLVGQVLEIPGMGKTQGGEDYEDSK